MSGKAPDLPVLIVGVTGAIGQAAARRFSESGCRIVGISRHRGSSPVVSDVQNPESAFYALDVTIETQARAFFADILRTHGKLGYMVYAAGLAPDTDTPLCDYSMNDWRRTVDTYATGFLICFQEALKSMAPGGHIVALSSAVPRFDNGNLPPLFIGHYSAAKAALNELCKWGRREANKRNLLLSRFAPSAVEVPFHLAAPPSRKPDAMIPLAYLVDRIVATTLSRKETDQEIVATADGITVRDLLK